MSSSGGFRSAWDEEFRTAKGSSVLGNDDIGGSTYPVELLEQSDIAIPDERPKKHPALVSVKSFDNLRDNKDKTRFPMQRVNSYQKL